MEEMRHDGARGFVPTGDLQRVDPDRILNAEQAGNRDVEYALKSRTHLWIVTVAHKATDQLLDAFDGKDGAQPILDAETLWMRPAASCFVCEQPYARRLRHRRCPGDPSGILR